MPLWVWGPACTAPLSCTHSHPHSFLGRRRAWPARECRMWEIVGLLGTNLSEIFIEVHIFSFKKMHLKMSSGKCRPFCLDLNMLITHYNRVISQWILYKIYTQYTFYCSSLLDVWCLISVWFSRCHLNSNVLQSSLPNAAYMRQWIGSALGQKMACRLFDAKPLSIPMLGYCQLDHWEQTSLKLLSKYKDFHSRKCIWIYRLRNGGHFVQMFWGRMCPHLCF